jgi:hypothetical protein
LALSVDRRNARLGRLPIGVRRSEHCAERPAVVEYGGQIVFSPTTRVIQADRDPPPAVSIAITAR